MQNKITSAEYQALPIQLRDRYTRYSGSNEVHYELMPAVISPPAQPLEAVDGQVSVINANELREFAAKHCYMINFDKYKDSALKLARDTYEQGFKDGLAYHAQFATEAKPTKEMLSKAFSAGELFANDCKCGECDYCMLYPEKEPDFETWCALATPSNNSSSEMVEENEWIAVDPELDIYTETNLQTYEQYFIVVAETGKVEQAIFISWETEGVEDNWVIFDKEYPLTYASHYQVVKYPTPPTSRPNTQSNN